MALIDDIQNIEDQLDEVFRRVQILSDLDTRTREEEEELRNLEINFSDLAEQLSDFLAAEGLQETPEIGRAFDFSQTDLEGLIAEYTRSLSISLAETELVGADLDERLQDLINFHIERSSTLEEQLRENLSQQGENEEDINNFIGELMTVIDQFYENINSQVEGLSDRPTIIPGIPILEPPRIPQNEGGGEGEGGDGGGGNRGGNRGQGGQGDESNPLNILDYLLFDFLRGLASGVRDTIEQVGRDFQKLTQNIQNGFRSMINTASRSLQQALKPLFSLQTAIDANTSRNLEKYIQAQSVNLLMTDVGQARTDARATVVALEKSAQTIGLSAREQENVAVAMSQMVQAVPDSLGINREALTTLLARAEAATQDLGGGQGQSISEFLQSVAQGKVTNRQLVEAAKDPVLSRLVDPIRGGRAITGNVVADVQNLITSLEELDQEVDFDAIVKSNPKRVLGQFFSDLYAPRTGIFGFLREFRITDITGGRTLEIDTTLLDQINNFLQISLEKVRQFFQMIGEQITGQTDMEPVQVLGTILNQLAAAIEQINMNVVAERLRKFFSFIGSIFNRENVEGLGNALVSLGETVNGIMKQLERFGLSIGEVVAMMIGFKFGGVTGAIIGRQLITHQEENIERKEKGEDREAFGLIAGLAKAIGLIFTVNLVKGIATEMIFGALRRFAIGRLLGEGGRNIMGSISGGFLTPLVKAVGVAALAFGGVRLAMNLASGEAESFGEVLSMTKNDFGDVMSVFGSIIVEAGRKVKDFTDGVRRFFFGERERTELDPALTAQTEAAGQRIGTGDLSALGFQMGERGGILAQSFDFLVGGQGIQPESNAEGDMQSTLGLIDAINKALAIESAAAPVGSDVILSAINSSERVFNQEQLQRIPDQVGRMHRDRMASVFAERAGNTSPTMALAGTGGSGTSTTTVNNNPNINVTINTQPGQSAEDISKMVIEQLNSYFSAAEMNYYA